MGILKWLSLAPSDHQIEAKRKNEIDDRRREKERQDLKKRLEALNLQVQVIKQEYPNGHR